MGGLLLHADAEEFICGLLDNLHKPNLEVATELNKVRQSSEFFEAVFWQLQSTSGVREARS